MSASRDDVFAAIRDHLADELELDPARITEDTRFKEDLDADSLDLYTLVQELEDSYGVTISDEEAARIHDGRPGGRLRDRPRPGVVLGGAARALRRAARAPAPQALTHSSWVVHRSDAYERLALLGDSVLGLSITSHIWPLLEPSTAPGS